MFNMGRSSQLHVVSSSAKALSFTLPKKVSGQSSADEGGRDGGLPSCQEYEESLGGGLTDFFFFKSLFTAISR